ncbi:MAG: ABC transporter substrate-binding protein [Deltaproteobacteria bacterium]|nr:ABC transporter substrate-binding protein [Deltaproteobacteria bacterium]
MFNHRRAQLVAGLFATLIICAAHSHAAQLESVTVGYSSFSGDYVPLWIGVEDRIGKKYGIDLKAVYAGRARPQQLLIGNEALIVIASGTGALTSHILGVKDQVIILTFSSKVPGVLFTKPEIKSAEDLKGKTIGSGRPGALGDIMARYVLRAKLNLVPDRDVKILPVGEPALALQALERGIVDGASFSGPQVALARKLGFRELVNYETVGIVYPYNTVTTLRQTINKNPDLLDKVLKIILEGRALFRSNKEKSLAVWKKYLRGTSDDVLDEAYQTTMNTMDASPQPSLAVIKSGLDILSLQYPQAKQTDPNLIFDASIVKRIEQSGFVDALNKK